MSHLSEEGVLRKLIQHMNSQLPARRLRLSTLMEMDSPHFAGKDGVEYALTVPELRLLRSMLDELKIGDIQLPIVLMGDASQSQSTWRIEGKAEVALVCRLLDRPVDGDRDKIFLYAPHIALIRRKLPTATVCMYLP